MSGWEQYRENRTSWGIDVLGSLVCIITASDGTQGVSTGFGGPPACWLIEQHFARFVVGSDPRDTVRPFAFLNPQPDTSERASELTQLFSPRRTACGTRCSRLRPSTGARACPSPPSASSTSPSGTSSARSAASPSTCVPLPPLRLCAPLQNLRILTPNPRSVAAQKMIGGRAKDGKIPFYLTGPEPTHARKMGFWGSKVALPYSPRDGFNFVRRNLDFLKQKREELGDDFPLMVDCYMSLDVHSAIQLAQGAIDEKIDITWWEEVRRQVLLVPARPERPELTRARTPSAGPAPGRL